MSVSSIGSSGTGSSSTAQADLLRAQQKLAADVAAKAAAKVITEDKTAVKNAQQAVNQQPSTSSTTVGSSSTLDITV
jgi:hypothetical protein